MVITENTFDKKPNIQLLESDFSRYVHNSESRIGSFVRYNYLWTLNAQLLWPTFLALINQLDFWTRKNFPGDNFAKKYFYQIAHFSFSLSHNFRKTEVFILSLIWQSDASLTISPLPTYISWECLFLKYAFNFLLMIIITVTDIHQSGAISEEFKCFMFHGQAGLSWMSIMQSQDELAKMMKRQIFQLLTNAENYLAWYLHLPLSRRINQLFD